ncbi:MAG: hypothetical protein ACRCZS_13225 [Chroococcidiopsis sp.]
MNGSALTPPAFSNAPLTVAGYSVGLTFPLSDEKLAQMTALALLFPGLRNALGFVPPNPKHSLVATHGLFAARTLSVGVLSTKRSLFDRHAALSPAVSADVYLQLKDLVEFGDVKRRHEPNPPLAKI